MALFDFLNFTWLRNLVGVRKDLIDTKKSQLEVQKLKDEETARKFITPATLDDVKEYDPKYRKIRSKTKSKSKPTLPLPAPIAKPANSLVKLILFTSIIIVLSLILLVIWFISR